MPELPEVETIRNGLQNKVVGKKISAVDVLFPKIIQGDKKEFEILVKNNFFEDIFRIGKLLIFKFGKGDKYLLAHLKMTGQLIYQEDGNIVVGGHKLPPVTAETKKDFYDLPNKYTRLIFSFADGSNLFFNDLRKFAYVKVVDKQERDAAVAGYGIEPLSKEFTLVNFKKVFEGKKKNVKAVLLDQSLIAGIGNIYADEICFDAKVCPDRSVNSLSTQEIKALYVSSEKIIKEAIKNKGTTFRDYVDASGQKGKHIDFLKVYNRKGEKCLRCKKGIIKKSKIAGRGTSYCEECQK